MLTFQSAASLRLTQLCQLDPFCSHEDQLVPHELWEMSEELR